MNIDKLLLDRPSMVTDLEMPGRLPSRIEDGGIDFDDEHRKKVARDFEGIFIHQLMDKMKETIPESDLEDSSSKEIKSMYWSFLADAVTAKGGLGLWENIYATMRQSAGLDPVPTPAGQVQSSGKLDTSA